MKLQRRLFLLACSLLLGTAASVEAQQVYIARQWVHHKARNCAVVIADSQIICEGGWNNVPYKPQHGNISNDPHIEFDRQPPAGAGFPECEALFSGCNSEPPGGACQFPGLTAYNICNEKVHLCTQIGYSNEQSGATRFALDFISFEVFKYSEGSNPLDPQSTPPLRTFFVDNPGEVPPGLSGVLEPVCVLWDGSINIKGEFGKSNGEYGFRAKVATNQTGASGNINIEQTRAYPGGFTMDSSGDSDPYNGDERFVDEKPITVNVTNVHVVRTSPTVVGALTGVAAEPYNITYRLSKDATMYLTIHDVDLNLHTPVIRTIVDGLPRVGEGIPSGTLQNGDSWNGRWNNGDLGPPGVYLASLQAASKDQWGTDWSYAATRQVALDTLQVTDVRVQPLTDLSTSLAVLSYVLTEPATAFVDIYPPGTAFSNGLTAINNLPDIGAAHACFGSGAKKDFGATLHGNSVCPIRHIEEQQDFRKSVISFWDGRGADGRIVDDGDYVFVLYAGLPSQNGFPFNGDPLDRRIWSTNAKSGFLTVARGMVTVSQVGPSSTVIGSSPSVAGLDPFTFSYSLSRDAIVSLKVLDQQGTRVVKTLVDNETRPGNFLNRERWLLPTDDGGLWVSSGTYMVQLSAADPFFPSKVSTTTALFPVNLFRITDIQTTPLLTGATDVITISYQLSQPMRAAWNIYPPGAIIDSSTTWPPCNDIAPGTCSQIHTGAGDPVSPLITIQGMRPGRLRITEFWDGRDINGLFVPDGNYAFTLTAESSTTPKFFATDKMMGILTVARGSIVFPVFNITPTYPALFNSSQTISLPPYEVDYSLTRQSSVTIQILTTDVAPRAVRTLIAGQVRDSNILNREFWDARDDAGNFVEPGFYTVRAVAEDLASQLSSGSTAQQTISVDPLRIYDVAISPLRPDFGTALIAYQVSETMKVSLKIYKPGTMFDANGNPSPPESKSLVKRIVGVRPARTEISEIWDGTDETLTIVPDGNYLFKIVASTDINSIDSITGDVKPGAALAEDLVIAEIPVVRGGSADVAGDFVANSIVYPNPVRGSTAKFKIYVPIEADVQLKIYNIAGDLVFDRGFGTYAQDTYVLYDWPKVNASGKTVAHGTYFALIREKSTRGEKALLQTVKKFLIP